MPKTKEQSIIEIIQQMVAEGESEEKIITTLKDLGVEPDKAKRLLLLGQADTFALLRGEINKIVSDEIDKELPKLNKKLEEEANAQTKRVAQAIENQIKQDLEEYEKELTGKSEKFETKISDTVAKVTELSDRVRTQLNNLGEQVKQVRIDLDEMKMTGIGQRNRLLSYAMILIGFAIVGASLYVFATTYFTELVSVDSIIYVVMLAFVGMGFLFMATQV